MVNVDSEVMVGEELERLEPVAFQEMRLARNPSEVIAEANLAAKALVDVVEKQKLFRKFGDKKHLFVEAWQTLGHFYGVTAEITKCVAIEHNGIPGFEAEAAAVRGGRVIGKAKAMCLSDEDNWSTRPKYEWDEGEGRKVKVGDVTVPAFQLESMCQTRAISKVLRSVLAWVVVLAGYSATPAEEMTGTERGINKPTPTRAPQRASESTTGGNGNSSDGSAPQPQPKQDANVNDPLISKPEATKLQIKAGALGWKPMEVLTMIRENFQIDSVEKLRKSEYEKVIRILDSGTRKTAE